MNNRHERPECAAEIVSLVKMPVRNSEEDETEEGVEGGTKKRQQRDIQTAAELWKADRQNKRSKR